MLGDLRVVGVCCFEVVRKYKTSVTFKAFTLRGDFSGHRDFLYYWAVLIVCWQKVYFPQSYNTVIEMAV